MFKQRSPLISTLSYSCKSLMGECKVKLIISYTLMIIGFFIGIFLAIRLNNAQLLENAKDYGYVSFSLSSSSSLSAFLWRFASFAIILLLLTIFSINIFLFPIGEIILIYRSYLVGLNTVIIILTGGLAGLFTSILILLPCQLVSLAAISTFFCIFSKQHKEPKKTKWKSLLVAGLALLVVDIVESVLLAIFGANIILVI